MTSDHRLCGWVYSDLRRNHKQEPQKMICGFPVGGYREIHTSYQQQQQGLFLVPINVGNMTIKWGERGGAGEDL